MQSLIYCQHEFGLGEYNAAQGKTILNVLQIVRILIYYFYLLNNFHRLLVKFGQRLDCDPWQWDGIAK